MGNVLKKADQLNETSKYHRILITTTYYKLVNLRERAKCWKTTRTHLSHCITNSAHIVMFVLNLFETQIHHVDTTAYVSASSYIIAQHALGSTYI